MNKPLIEFVNRKSMIIRESGRSTDFISPSFGYGCLYNCTYCYMKRHLPDGLTIAKNEGDILTAINNHSVWLTPKIPNQTHKQYYTYDISCNEDFALHCKYHNWQRIFDFFKDDDKIMGSFATKYVNIDLLEYNSKEKIRIRFSLIPENIRVIVEPNTSKIVDRLKAINHFIEAGYDVHINFSPIIVYDNWLYDYNQLFILIDSIVNQKYKSKVLAECIFLTHNESKHLYNTEHNLPGEYLLWAPKLQESKVSQYGGKNIRYNRFVKKDYINQFTKLHNKVIPWNTIRYIF